MTTTFTPQVEGHWFWERYWSILKMALTAGVPKLSLIDDSFPPKHKSAKDEREFYRACHRGYDKAQRRIVETIVELRNDEDTSEDLCRYFELFLRRVIDAIAFGLFGGEIHIIRRFVIDDNISSLNMEDILSVKEVVDGYNSSSRLSFALLADLSTYIQVGDIVRVDFREGRPKLNIIEVKSGKVNHLLNDFLDRFQSDPGALEAIKHCKVLDDRYKKQAQRMMKQRIRMAQLHEVMTTDHGVDIKSGQTISFPAKRVETASYGPDLNEVCEVATKNGWSGVRIDETIHAVAFRTQQLSEDPTIAQRLLMHSLIESRYAQPEIREVEKRMLEHCDPSEVVRIINPVRNNMVAMACIPCLVWPMENKHINNLLCGDLQLLFAFDTPGFIHLVNELGGQVRFSTKREAHEIRKEFGKSASISWDGKFMVIDEMTQLGGHFSRIINDLNTPGLLVKGMLEQIKEVQLNPDGLPSYSKK